MMVAPVNHLLSASPDGNSREGQSFAFSMSWVIPGSGEKKTSVPSVWIPASPPLPPEPPDPPDPPFATAATSCSIISHHSLTSSKLHYRRAMLTLPLDPNGTGPRWDTRCSSGVVSSPVDGGSLIHHRHYVSAIHLRSTGVTGDVVIYGDKRWGSLSPGWISLRPRVREATPRRRSPGSTVATVGKVPLSIEQGMHLHTVPRYKPSPAAAIRWISPDKPLCLQEIFSC